MVRQCADGNLTSLHRLAALLRSCLTSSSPSTRPAINGVCACRADGRAGPEHCDAAGVRRLCRHLWTDSGLPAGRGAAAPAGEPGTVALRRSLVQEMRYPSSLAVGPCVDVACALGQQPTCRPALLLLQPVCATVPQSAGTSWKGAYRCMQNLRQTNFMLCSGSCILGADSRPQMRMSRCPGGRAPPRCTRARAGPRCGTRAWWTASRAPGRRRATAPSSRCRPLISRCLCVSNQSARLRSAGPHLSRYET